MKNLRRYYSFVSTMT